MPGSTTCRSGWPPWRASPALRTRAWSWWLLAGGLGIFCIGDVIYLFEQSSGTYREGGLLDVTWPIGGAVLGLAACANPEVRRRPIELSGVLAGGHLARLGGDEFGAFIDVASPDDALALAQRAMASLDTPFVLDDETVSITGSAGVALSPLHGRRRNELLRFADVAMYDAKRGRSAVAVYDANRDPNTQGRLHLIEELRGAIQQRRIELHYQPILDVRSGRVTGIEALARWRRHDGTLTYPDSFIAHTERIGLIHELTRAVPEQAIEFHANLSRVHPGLSLSVNISRHDLAEQYLSPFVSRLLDVHSMPAKQLTLEITETALVAGGAQYFLNESDIIIASDDATFFDPHANGNIVSALEPIGMLARGVPLGDVLR